MLRTLSTVARLGIAAALIAAGAASAQAESQRLEAGKQLFRRYCSACHGLDARGDGPLRPVLTTPPADLTQLEKRHGKPLPKAMLVEYIDGRRPVRAHGPSDMPVWGARLLEDVPPSSAVETTKTGTIMLIVGYLESIQQR